MERRGDNRQCHWWVLSLLLLGAGWLFHPRSTVAASSFPVLPVEGTYTNQTAHWDGSYRLTRTDDWVTATLGSARSPVQHHARQQPTVLFTVPPGFRPAHAVTTSVPDAYTVTGQGLDVAVPLRAFGLHVDTNGAVRYVDDARLDGVGHLRYAATLTWETEDAVCGDGPLHGRTQRVVDAVTAVVPGAGGCWQVTTADLVQLQELDMSGIGSWYNPLTLRPGDLAGLDQLQELDLSNNSLAALPHRLFIDLPALRVLDLSTNCLGTPMGYLDLHNLDLTGRSLDSLPPGLSELEVLNLSRTCLTTLPSDFFAELTALQHLDLSHNPFQVLPSGLFAGLHQLRSLHLEGWGPAYPNMDEDYAEHWNRISMGMAPLPSDLFVGLDQLQVLHINKFALDTLPADLFAHTPQLRVLDLGFNLLRELPSNLFADLDQLQTLDLAGPLSSSRWEWKDTAVVSSDLLANLPQLQELRLLWEEAGGPLPQDLFAGLPHLQELHLFWKDINPSPLPPDLFVHTPRLEALHLVWWSRKLPPLPEDLLAALPQLQHLQLNRLLTSDMHPSLPLPSDLFSHNPRLQILDLTHYQLEMLPPDLFVHNPLLEVLDLSGNNLTTLPPDLFSHNPQLRLLDLDSNGLTVLPSGLFAHTPLLEVLDLGADTWRGHGDFSNRLMALDPDLFTHTSYLRRLDFSYNPLTTLAPALFSGLTRLEVLDLGCTGLTALDPVLFADLSQLRELYLGPGRDSWGPCDNELATLDPDLFTGLPQLQVLDLAGNPLTELPSGLFAHNPHLQILDLSRTQLTTLDSDLLAGLTHLRYLDLERNELMALDPDLFRDLIRLQKLNLWATELSCLPRHTFREPRRFPPRGAPYHRLYKDTRTGC